MNLIFIKELCDQLFTSVVILYEYKTIFDLVIQKNITNKR